MNENKRINFRVCYINDLYKWGFEVIDTIDNLRLISECGFTTIAEAREAGRREAIKMIHYINRETKI